MFKKMIMLSMALVVAPCLVADDVKEDAVVGKSAVSFFKDHKTAFVVAAVMAACGLYAYNNGCFKKKAIAE